jgi:uncharacterized membrane protein YoaK (UPF0700 family)
MIYKLERWAWWGGAALAGIAGIVNAVGLKSYAHQAVTHVTGTTSLFALAVAHGDTATWMTLGTVLAAFFAGATLSGWIIPNDALKLGRSYGAALLVESALLFTASVLMHSDVRLGSYFASAACGLQNAMASTYSGAVLRTTHLSGMFTDCGAAIGHWFRRAPVAWIRVRLYALLIAAFAAGGIAGSLLFDVYGPATLFIPAALTGVAGLGYMAYIHWRRDLEAVK